MKATARKKIADATKEVNIYYLPWTCEKDRTILQQQKITRLQIMAMASLHKTWGGEPRS